MELSRYTFPDAYILEELRRTYQASDTQGRIQLLQQVYRDDRRALFDVALLAVVRTNFETIVVSGLTFIYVEMQCSSAVLGRLHIENAYSSAFQFARIARLLHDPESSSYEATLNEASETYHKTDVWFYITLFFRGGISIMASWKLLTAIL